MSEKEKEEGIVSKILGKIAKFMKKILVLVFLNRVLLFIVGFLIGARVFEASIISMKGTTVWVTGVCMTSDSYPRALAEDQVIVASVKDSVVSAMIRSTRENIVCDTDKVAIDIFGPLSEMNKPLVKVPKIKKLDLAKYKKVNHKQYENKKVMISGVCYDAANTLLEPYIEKIMHVSSIQETKLDPSIFYLRGVVEEDEKRIPIKCSSQDVTFGIVSSSMMASGKKEEKEYDVEKTKKDYVGKKVVVTGICFPDMNVYKKIGQEPPQKFYNFQKAPIEITVNKFDDKGEVELIAGSSLDQKTYQLKGKKYSTFGHKIICRKKDYPFVMVDARDVSIDVKKGEGNE